MRPGIIVDVTAADKRHGTTTLFWKADPDQIIAAAAGGGSNLIGIAVALAFERGVTRS